MKVLGYVNRFNRGIERVKQELEDNKNPEPIFDIDKITSFGVIVKNTSSSPDLKIEDSEFDHFEQQLKKFGRNSEEVRFNSTCNSKNNTK